MTIRAVYEKGVFRPTGPVNLPENCEVDVVVRQEPTDDAKLESIYRIMGESYVSGETDVAERHNEHQP
jgi:predicted DNA-binding antitoxin AbrB/MazE fold protein